ncbi:MAG: DUF1643 domain-containing protein [Nocardioides sp.]
MRTHTPAAGGLVLPGMPIATSDAPFSDAPFSDAQFSDDGRFRYLLTRSWDRSGPVLGWVMLNPSTADAAADDATIRRCLRFARDLGYGGIAVVNLYAYRATHPADLWTAADPVGPGNDAVLAEFLTTRATAGQLTVAGWGTHAPPGRVTHVAGLPGAERLHCLAVTRSGAPGHPLRLAATSRPTLWRHHP